MPRKIGYGDFTPARRAALKKAALESARKRRKHKSEKRSNKKRKKQIAAAAAVAGVGIGVGVGLAYKNKVDTAKRQRKEYEDLTAEIEREADELKRESDAHKQRMSEQRARIAELEKQAGNIHGAPESQEEWDARVELYGIDNMIGETSPVHLGRPEIFPGIPMQVAMQSYQNEMIRPSYDLWDEADDDGYVTLYHRTSGGEDHDGASAKAAILKEQQMMILNRDEIRAGAGMDFHDVWLSNRLNDSNTRNAFGEHVVQIKIHKSRMMDIKQTTFGDLSPNKEVWAAVNVRTMNRLLSIGEVQFQDVPAEMIQPKPERKFKVPK